MSVQFRGSTGEGSNLAEVHNDKALRISGLGPDYIGSAGGKYRMSLQTNIATVISALTAAGAGHIGQFRWGSTTKTCLVDKIEIGFTPITNATAFQRLTLMVRKTSAHTASASGGTTTAVIGTVAILTGESGKLRSTYPTTALTDFRMTDTADLTVGVGARVFEENDFLSLNTSSSTVAAAPESAKERRSAVWNANGHPLVLTQDTGLTLANRILWTAALTATVDMAIEWRELVNSDVPSF